MVNLNEQIKKMEAHGFKPRTAVSFTFGDPANCRKILLKALQSLDKTATIVWLPEYDQVAEWLSNTRGKGLLLTGNCGRGKTNIITLALPFIFDAFAGKLITPVHVDELPDKLAAIKSKWCYCIDEVGAEHITNDYGERFFPFMKLINIAEREQKFCLFSTNLTGIQIRERYDERTLDRIARLCHVVKFEGASLRK